MHTGDEEDDSHWVQEQIRKGVGVGQTPQQASAHTAAVFAQSAGRGQILTAKAAADEVVRSGQAAMHTLQQNLERIKVASFKPISLNA